MKRSKWKVRRKKPYSEIGIRRIACARCDKPSVFQWQVCADGNNYRGLCASCDIALNRLVLDWMGHPEADQLLEAYRKSVSQ